jgi:hypothetical protein
VLFFVSTLFLEKHFCQESKLSHQLTKQVKGNIDIHNNNNNITRGIGYHKCWRNTFYYYEKHHHVQRVLLENDIQ